MAVINGLIALAVAILPVRRSVLKLRLGAAAAVLGLLTFGSALAVRYTVYVQEERQLAERRDARDRLEVLLADGQAILAQIRNPQVQLPNRAADEWAQRAENVLRDRLGELAVSRFRKDVNEMYGDATVPADRLAYWHAVRNRLVNLEMMAAELPSPRRLSTVSTPKL